MKIEITGNAPVQSVGKIDQRYHYYFRARHNTWSMEIREKENGDWLRLFTFIGRYGLEYESEASWLDHEEAESIILACLDSWKKLKRYVK